MTTEGNEMKMQASIQEHRNRYFAKAHDAVNPETGLYGWYIEGPLVKTKREARELMAEFAERAGIELEWWEKENH